MKDFTKNIVSADKSAILESVKEIRDILTVNAANLLEDKSKLINLSEVAKKGLGDFMGKAKASWYDKLREKDPTKATPAVEPKA